MGFVALGERLKYDICFDHNRFRKLNLFNLKNDQCNDLVSQRLGVKKMNVIHFWHIMNSIVFPVKGKLRRSNSFWCVLGSTVMFSEAVKLRVRSTHRKT
jgi:hypothetical protein